VTSDKACPVNPPTIPAAAASSDDSSDLTSAGNG
jgi:hypothetical protein